MQRRRFVQSTVGAALAGTAALPGLAQNESAASTAREVYELRRYHLISGPQEKVVSAYMAEALIPALNRLGVKPVGAFNLYIGPETPSLYLLLPASSADVLAGLEGKLASDDEYQKAGQAFLNAPAAAPAYERMESSLLRAFEGFPKLTPPPQTATKAQRVFQMRTYESPSQAAHRRKIEMFHTGEFDIFREAGFNQVFYGDMLIGQRLPNLTYMLSFPDLSELNAKWAAFGSNPNWKKLVSSPRFNYESIVSNITNLILNPAAYSQI